MADLKTLKTLVIGGVSYNIGWSENDFTSALKAKLEGIEEGAQVNVIEKIMMNGQQVAVSEKSVDLGNLQKSLTAGTGINIAEDGTISTTLDIAAFKVVSELPAAPEAGNENKIHVVLDADSTDEGNQYAEYLWVNGKWELVGKFKADMDLSAYAKTSEVEGMIATVNQSIATNRSEVDAAIALKADTTSVNEELAKKVDKEEGKGLSTNDYTTLEKEKLAGITAGANKVTPSYEEATSTLTITIE